MANRTKFQGKWLELEDCNGIVVSKWVKKDLKDPFSCICIVCNVNISTDKGFERLQQHAKTVKHVGNLTKLDGKQFHFFNTRSLFSPKDAATRAQIFWVMETIKTNCSTRSCNGKKEVFQMMFPGCVPDSFSISANKAQYLITEAIGPHFQNLLLNELQKPNVYFTLQYDETSNVKSKKELQIRVRFWSDTDNTVVSRHLVTYFIGKADGDTLFSYLLKALYNNGLFLKNVLAIACDGPYVNKKFLRLFSEKLEELHYKSLTDIETCQIHIAHKAFLNGTECLLLDISDFIIKVYYFFHHRDLRCEDFEKIQEKLHLPQRQFLKHVDTRWLTEGPAAERLLKQLPALKEYILIYIPKKETATLTKQNYLDIRNYIKNESLECSLKFVVFASKIFTAEFTGVMQREEPLIHVLYSQLKKLITLLLSSIIKPSILAATSLENVDIDAFLKEASNLIDLTRINVGKNAKESLEKLPTKDQLFLLSTIRKFYMTSAKHLFKKTSTLKNLKYFQCLAPENIKKHESVRYIKNVADALPLTDVDVDKLTMEWKLLQLDVDLRFTLNESERVDSYWSTIFRLKTSPNASYPKITKVVQAALALAHGSADVERGFSKSGQLLTEDKAHMSEKMLNAKLAITYVLKRHDFMVHKVPIPDKLLRRARLAHNSYQLCLEYEARIANEKAQQQAVEAERQAKEKLTLKNIDKEKRTIQSLEEKLKSVEESHKNASSDAESMQNALKGAIKTKAENAVIQELINSLEKFRKTRER